MFVADIFIGGVKTTLALKKSQKQLVSLTFKDDEGVYKNVQVKGEMNAWNPGNSDFTFENGVWTWEFTVSPGKYQYLFVLDGKETKDPSNPVLVDNNIGGFNNLLEVKKASDKNAPVLTTVKSGEKMFELIVENEATNVIALWDNYLLDDSHVKIKGQSVFVTIPSNAKDIDRSFIRVYALNEGGVSNDILIPLEKGSIIRDASLLKRHDFEASVFYFMMVDRFNNGNPSNDEKVDNDEILPPANYFGGDLAGVTQKIKDGYFEELGVNTIWVSPIVQNPKGAFGLWPEPRSRFSGYHGYWPVSSTKVDYRFGTEEELRDLISLAHDNDFNVVIDYVANHVHELHPVFQNNPEWATNLYLPDGSLNTQRWDDHRLTTWFDTFLPTLNLEIEEVADKMSDSALYWIEEFNFDGIRHDATKHIPISFQRTLTKKLKEKVSIPRDQRMYQIGETYGSPSLIGSYVNSGMLDAQFDFNMYDAAVAAFAKEEETFDRMDDVLQQSISNYGNHHLMGNISGNQDRARFISYASGDVLFSEDAKLAGWTREIGVKDKKAYNRLIMLQAFNMTIPGIPVIYYGDEFGMPGGNDPDNRRMMRFEGLSKEEAKVKEAVEKLVKLRRSNMALLFGDLQVQGKSETTYAYYRNYFDTYAFVAFNKGNEDAIIQFDAKNFKVEDLQAQFGSDLNVKDGMIEVIVPANQFEIVVTK
jgi:glycosidase